MKISEILYEMSSRVFSVPAGKILYHTSMSELSSFQDKICWFTPTLREARIYHGSTDNAHTYKCKWIGGKVASPKQYLLLAKQVWPDLTEDDLEDSIQSYSLFDANQHDNHDEKEKVNKFLKILKDHQFEGAIHLDYTPMDDEQYVLVAFHPNKTIKIVEELNVKPLKFSEE